MVSIAMCASLAVLVAPARAEAPVTRFRCDGSGDVAAMENSFIAATGQGACWFHLGHHTYDTGAPHRIGHVVGSVFSVEVTFSPPTELGVPTNPTSPIALLAFEGSLDGLTWTTLASIPYRLRVQRQAIDFDFDAQGALARFLRIRQPRAASQGLSGYLDSSSFDADLTAVPPVASTVSAARSLTCSEDIMERFFAEHPCWFGGINRYDAPSVFHTYPLGPSVISHVSGTATLLPWRSDDYAENGGSETEIRGFLQTSVDGATWNEVANFVGTYGDPIPFDVTFEQPVEASFARLVAEYHTGLGTHPALKHVRGMLLDSSLHIS